MSTAACMALVDGREFGVTRHALERWVDRVKPMLEPGEAARDLSRVLALAGHVGARPEWAAQTAEERGWVMVGDSIAFPIGRSDLLVTCVTRGEPSEETRAVIRDLQRRRRERKNARGRREKHGKVKRAARVQRQREAFD